MSKKLLFFNALKEEPLDVRITSFLRQLDRAAPVAVIAYFLNVPARDVSEKLRKLEQYGRAEAAICNGVTFWNICNGKPISGGVLRNGRPEISLNPKWEKMEARSA